MFSGPTLIVLLGVILLILLFVPFGGGKKKNPTVGKSALPDFLQPTPAQSASSPFQLGLQEDTEFLVAAYREHAMAEKRAEVAAKAAKYFAKSE